MWIFSRTLLNDINKTSASSRSFAVVTLHSDKFNPHKGKREKRTGVLNDAQAQRHKENIRPSLAWVPGASPSPSASSTAPSLHLNEAVNIFTMARSLPIVLWHSGIYCIISYIYLNKVNYVQKQKKKVFQSSTPFTVVVCLIEFNIIAPHRVELNWTKENEAEFEIFANSSNFALFSLSCIFCMPFFRLSVVLFCLFSSFPFHFPFGTFLPSTCLISI